MIRSLYRAYAYRVVEARRMPLVGNYEARRYLLSREVTHWVRIADDDAVWMRVPRKLLSRLDMCDTKAKADHLISATLRQGCAASAGGRSGVVRGAPTPATGPTRALPPLRAGRVPGGAW